MPSQISRSTALVLVITTTLTIAIAITALIATGQLASGVTPDRLELLEQPDDLRSYVASEPVPALLAAFPTAMHTLAGAAGYQTSQPPVNEGLGWHRVRLSAMKMPKIVRPGEGVILARQQQPKELKVGQKVGRVLGRLEKEAKALKHMAYPSRGLEDRGRGPSRGRAVQRRGRVQSLVSEAASMGYDVLPDLDDDVRIKDTKDLIKDIYRPLAPDGSKPGDGAGLSDQDRDYSSFYRAYSAYQMPRQASNSKLNLGKLGDENLPPDFLPYADAYYPNGGGRAAVTINANGEGSTNSFNVAGPGAINVNYGGGVAGGVGGAAGGYVYPDGKRAARASVEIPQTQVVGAPSVAASDGESVGGEEGCDSDNPDCQFWQDAYDDAAW